MKKKIVEDAQIITQERVQNRTVKQKLFTAAQLRLNTLKWNVYVERVVEQIIDVQKTTSGEDRQGSENHAASRGHAVPTLCSWKESQDRIQQRTSEQVANTRVQPPVNPVEAKQPKNNKMTTQRKHFPGQEKSQVNKRVEDAVKVKIIKMKVQ